MKKWIVILFLFCLVMSICAQNGVNGGEHFLLLKDKETVSLNIYKNEKIEEIKTFSIPDKPLYTTDRQKRVAIVDIAKNNIVIHDFVTTEEQNLTVPFNMKLKCILLEDDNLFVGGLGEEMLLQYNITSEKWFALEIPSEIYSLRKSIDDLLIHKGFLLAVDNMVLPKYMIYYRLNGSKRVVFSSLKRLSSYSPNENTYAGRITDKYMALISFSSSAHSGLHQNIVFYKANNWKYNFAITTQVKGEDYFSDFAIINDYLVLANREQGLYVLKIEPSFVENPNKVRYKHSDEQIYSTILKTDDSEYKYIKNLTIIPNTTKVVLTLEDEKGKLKQKVVDISQLNTN